MLGSKTKIREQAGKAFLEKWHLQGDLKEVREEARQIFGGGGGGGCSREQQVERPRGWCVPREQTGSQCGWRKLIREKVVGGSSEAGEGGTDCQAVVWTWGFVLRATRGHW